MYPNQNYQYQQQQQYQQPMQGGMPGQMPQGQQPMQNQNYQQQPPMQQQYQQPVQNHQQQPTQQNANNGGMMMIQGRIVWTSGDLYSGKPQVDDKTKAPIIDPKTNLQTVQYGFGLAVPKNSPQAAELLAIMQREALTIYPNGQFPNDFAWKYKDGDGNDHNGKPFGDREGHAGHWILACTTYIPLKFYIWQGNGNVQVNTGIKSGDYVNVQLNIKAHPPVGRGKAGLYLNPSAVQLIQSGKEIVNAPSGDQIFSMGAPTYNGQMVIDPGPGAMPGQMPMNNQGYQQQTPQQPMQNPQYPQQGQQFQNALVDPHYGVLPQHHQPQQGNGGQPMGMPGAPVGPGQNQYPQTNTAGNMGQGQQYANGAYPSNPQQGGMPMPGQQQYR